MFFVIDGKIDTWTIYGQFCNVWSVILFIWCCCLIMFSVVDVFLGWFPFMAQQTTLRTFPCSSGSSINIAQKLPFLQHPATNNSVDCLPGLGRPCSMVSRVLKCTLICHEKHPTDLECHVFAYQMFLRYRCWFLDWPGKTMTPVSTESSFVFLWPIFSAAIQTTNPNIVLKITASF